MTIDDPASGGAERAVPYCCPFCAEEDLRPLAAGDVDGLATAAWHCRSCLRVFSLAFHGLHRPVQPRHSAGARLSADAATGLTNLSERLPLESDRS